MKIHWGHGLALTMILFIVFIVTMGINMGRTKIELESKDYYERGIQHDEQQEMERNTAQLEETPFITIDYDKEQVNLVFPKSINAETVTGRVEFYRPSNSKLDKTIELNLINNQQLLGNSSDLVQGIWDVKVYWEVAGKKYYLLKRLNL